MQTLTVENFSLRFDKHLFVHRPECSYKTIPSFDAKSLEHTQVSPDTYYFSTHSSLINLSAGIILHVTNSSLAFLTMPHPSNSFDDISAHSLDREHVLWDSMKSGLTSTFLLAVLSWISQRVERRSDGFLPCTLCFERINFCEFESNLRSNVVAFF